ncbi:MAG: SDR family oxidoreductase [Gaiellales bacterium]
MIVVTGATGHVGGLLAHELARRGADFRLAVTAADRAPDVPAEVVVASYDDAASLDRALEAGDRVFMVSMFMPPERRLPLHRAFVEAAVRNRVGHVIYLSFTGAGADTAFTHGRAHGETERMLAESGLSWAALRNGMYSDELPSWFDASGRITGPGGDGRVSFSFRPELAETLAILLLDEAHDQRHIVTVTGPESVTLAELARVASEVTGDDYRYEPDEPGDWVAYRRSLGREDWAIEAGLSYYRGVAAGEADVVGQDYERLTGKLPITLAQHLDRLRAEMPLARSSS